MDDIDAKLTGKYCYCGRVVISVDYGLQLYGDSHAHDDRSVGITHYIMINK